MVVAEREAQQTLILKLKKKKYKMATNAKFKWLQFSYFYTYCTGTWCTGIVLYIVPTKILSTSENTAA